MPKFYLYDLSKPESAFISNYRKENRLKCAVLLKHFQIESRFPESFGHIPDIIRKSLSSLLKISDDLVDLSYDYLDRTGKRMRHDVREFLRFRTASSTDLEIAQSELTKISLKEVWIEINLEDSLKEWFKNNKIERPTYLREERIINSVSTRLEEFRYQSISQKLSSENGYALDQLLQIHNDDTSASLVLLKNDPGKPCLSSILIELSKLKIVNDLDLPSDLFSIKWYKIRNQYYTRTMREPVRELRRHPDYIRHPLLAAFCMERREGVIDGLTNLLIQIVHKIQVKAERKVAKEMAGSVREISDKKSLLFKIAKTAVIVIPDDNIRIPNLMIRYLPQQDNSHFDKQCALQQSSFSLCYCHPGW
ncbi:MAG: DUF4158 domain-containing protein [Lentisphaeria bacterium]|nr:DUF4158 domain-containing protein [Lentisphaeria bacterium]NQZ66747.1 DUF4158 domain-containing protein [Lentisphaeria bacterium]